MKKNYITTFEAAKLMSVSPNSILNWVKSGKLAAFRTLGGHHRVERKNVEALIKKDEKTIHSGV